MLAGAALALALIGAVLVWAATRDAERAAGSNPNGYLYRHLVNIAIAAGADARRLAARRAACCAASARSSTSPACSGCCSCSSSASTINGAHAWIRLGGGFEMQPSEFMKLGLVVGMAVLFAQRGRDRGDRAADDDATCCWRSAWSPCRSR